MLLSADHRRRRRREKKKKKKHVELGANETHGGAGLEAMVARRMLGDQEPPGSLSAEALR